MNHNNKYDLSLLSLNVRGLNCTIKCKAIFRWLELKKNNIIFQETYSCSDIENQWQKEWKGNIFFSHGESNSRGCMILTREGLDLDVFYEKSCNIGRYILIKCEIEGEPFTLLNVYAPNTEHEQVIFILNINKILNCNDISASDNIIIGGDWNVVRDQQFDKSGGIFNIKHKTLDQLDQLMNNFELNDIWRIKNPNHKRFTWRQTNPLIQCRLDFWLISDSLYDTVNNTDIIPSVRSDHSAIILNLSQLDKIERGPGLWKFNNSLLEDATYINELKNKITKWKQNNHMDDKQVQWEYFKYKIRKFTIDYSKAKKKIVKTEEDRLTRQLIYLERNLCNVQMVAQYEETKHKLKLIENERVKGQIVRSRIKWHEQGEQSSKFFLGLEKSNAIKKIMRKLTLKDGTTTTNPDIISNTQRQFYETLYSSSNVDNILIENYSPFDMVKQLDITDRDSCEGLITEQECKLAIESLAKNRSPGNDGLTVEFYLMFFEHIKDILTSSFNIAHVRGELSSSQKQAVITLINKKGKDRQLIENWRPISLLNVDYKIASKAISKRLHNIIPKLVDISQTGFVKNRLIGDTVRVLNDIIELSQSRKENVTLLMIDFEKAFDSLEWNFLFKTLKAMNFGPSLISWIKTFYANSESCIINNGKASKYFKLSRGVRQGDPLSSYLFVLAVELLAISVRQNDHIHGIRVQNLELKIVQYADDTTAILKDLDSIKSFISLTKDFQAVSGLKLNESKTEAMWLGPNEPNFKLPGKIKWSKEPIKVLGIYLSCDPSKMIETNFNIRIKSIKNSLHMWKQRNLSLTGKILIVKAIAMSQIIYLANLLPFPDEKIKEIERILYDFIWNCSIHKVKKNVFIQDYKSGGHSMPDLRSVIQTQKLKWVKLYLNNHNCYWRLTMEELLHTENLNILLRSNFCVDEFSDIPPFYSEVLRALSKITHSLQHDRLTHDQFLYFNRHIKISKKTVYNKELLGCGLWRVNDLFDKENNIITFNILQQRGASAKCYLKWRSIINIVINKVEKPFNKQKGMIQGIPVLDSENSSKLFTF